MQYSQKKDETLLLFMGELIEEKALYAAEELSKTLVDNIVKELVYKDHTIAVTI